MGTRWNCLHIPLFRHGRATLLLGAVLAAWADFSLGETSTPDHEKTVALALAAQLEQSGESAAANLEGRRAGKPVSPRPERPDTPEKYADFERILLRSRVTDVQPMTGLVLWADNPKARDWPVQLEFSYMLYSDVCPEKGVFDWTPVDNLLDAIAARGHQAVLRFRYTYVDKPCAVPDWIKALPNYEETVGKSEGKRTAFPDWRCQELQDFHLEFHRRFAERYDSDPRLAFLETGFGLWAEYHIYDGPFVLGRTFPSKEFQARFLRSMASWFRHCPWCLSIDAADDTYSPFASEPSLLNLRFGTFDDSFLCKDHDGYNADSWRFFGQDRYRTSPFGGEFSYDTSHDQRHCLDPAGLHGRVFEDEAATYHMTFIIANDQPKYQSRERFREASLAMGYRFTVADVLVRGYTAALCVRNNGVAPLYRDAFMAVNGVRSRWSLRQLMPGEIHWVEITDASISTENCSVSIECDHLVPGQTIPFDADVHPDLVETSAPQAPLPIRLFIALYRTQISPALATRCPLTPSCSEFFLQASARHGWLGPALGADRFFRESSFIGDMSRLVETPEGELRYADPVEDHDFWLRTP